VAGAAAPIIGGEGTGELNEAVQIQGSSRIVSSILEVNGSSISRPRCLGRRCSRRHPVAFRLKTKAHTQEIAAWECGK
jgi:hypothetical protein